MPDSYKKVADDGFKTISNLEKEIAGAVLEAPQEIQDVIQALLLRYKSDTKDGSEVARAIKKLMGIS